MGCLKLTYQTTEPQLKVVHRRHSREEKCVQWFLSVDPLAEKTLDPFGYVWNNPIRWSDPTGMEPEDWYRNGDKIKWFDDSSAIHRDNSGQVWSYFSDGNDANSTYQSKSGSTVRLSDDRTFDESGLDVYENGKGALGMFKGGVQNNLLEGEIGANFMEYEYYAEKGPAAMAAGASYKTISAKGDVRVGSELLGFNLGAKGEILSANGNLDVGLFTGERKKYGFLFDANAGAYAAQGDVTVGYTILGVKITYTSGASLGSIHAGAKVGAYYDTSTDYFTIDGLGHLGDGVGLKKGLKIEIPLPGIYNLLNK